MISIFSDVHNAGVVSPRGLLTKELINYSYSVDPGAEFLTHPGRKFNLAYAKREMLWYLQGQRFDTSICDYAKAWSDCIAKDGGINSNYGQYLFGPQMQLDRCFMELAQDPDSRRAVAMILGQHSLHWAGIDQPCTVSIQFLIRPKAGADMDINDRPELVTIVTMRSQDLIFGLGNDVPAFMMVSQIMASALGVDQGALHVNVGSLHVYQRHFQMLERIVNAPGTWSVVDRLPYISTEHAAELIMGRVIDCEFTKWLRGEV